jgi:hypothetical protein
LGDIPILGNLFKLTRQENTKVNMLIFITPHIIKDTSDFTAVLKQKIEQRNKFIEQNYGKKQRTAIRNVIKAHREDLLEYKEGVTGQPEPETPPGPAAVHQGAVTTAPSPAAAKPKAAAVPAPKSVQAPAPVEPGKKPVITVPSEADQGEMYKGVTTRPSTAPTTAPTKPLATTEVPNAPSTSPAATTAPAEQRVKPPVINVPPPSPGTRGEELDLAY